jgi:hypothetical protein
MYGLTRGSLTLIGAGVAGLLVWAATRIGGGSAGEYWAIVGLLAAAGLVMALSQLLGGWTKWGWPRVSGSVFLVAFIPVLIVAGWVLLDLQPSANWFQRHIESWSGDIGLDGLVHDLGRAVDVLAFGLGLVFGLIFDTTGPRTEPVFHRRAAEEPPPPAPGYSERPEAVTPAPPQPETPSEDETSSA